MPFTGKATYSAGSTLPELAEDVGDIVGIVSPYETPLLDHLGDPQRAATSTVHQWLEDTLLPNTDRINDDDLDGFNDEIFEVTNGSRFRIGDQVQASGSSEVLFVTGISGNELTVVRGYGNTTAEELVDDQTLHILGNAALEGDDAPSPRFTSRVRQSNYTQIFTATVEVSGSQLAAKQAAIADELDYQKQERLRELLRDLENCVINGTSPASTPEGSASTRRTMRGIVPSIQTTIDDAGGVALTEDRLNSVMRGIWEQSSGGVDTIVVGGLQKRAINQFIASSRGYDARNTRYRDMVSVYESDFGVCRVVLSRWVPRDAVLLIDSSRIDVLPLSARSFHYKPLATTGDRTTGQVIGEYTVEMLNENAHGLIRNLSVA
ncbi:MAG: DUF5309 family protein [Planctomycetota bacterium]